VIVSNTVAPVVKVCVLKSLDINIRKYNTFLTTVKNFAIKLEVERFWSKRYYIMVNNASKNAPEKQPIDQTIANVN